MPSLGRLNRWRCANNAAVTSEEAPASTRYELCEPVNPRLWGLRVAAALIVGLLIRDDPGYRGAYRYRVRDKHSGEYVYDVTISAWGVEDQEVQDSLKRDLDRLSVHDFERRYSIDRGGGTTD